MLELVSPSTAISLLGLTYTEYLELCQNYSRLLENRYQEARIPADSQAYFVDFPDIQNWIIIVEDDNPDAISILPIVQRIADTSPRINLYIVPGEHDLGHIEQLLDDDLDEELAEMEFPLLLIFDEEWAFQAFWGPRPEAADSYLMEWFEANPEYEELAADDSLDNQGEYQLLLDNLTLSMRSWYNSGLQDHCVEEIWSILKNLQAQDDSDETSEDRRTERRTEASDVEND